jgi:hypothetical protein
MRILLMVVVGIVLLVAGVVVIGWILPKRHIATRSASYRARPEQLFGLISGSQNWRPDVLRTDPVSDPAGRELMRETARNGEVITYEVLDRIPPRSMTRRIVTANLPYAGSWTYSLQPGDGVTVVRITEDGEVYNPVFRFMSRFVLGHTGTMDAYLRALGKATGQDIEIND